jgi:HK97 family phage major capsid protein
MTLEEAKTMITKEIERLEARSLADTKRMIGELAGTPDRSTVAKIISDSRHPYGSAGRTRPAWEQAYERNAHLWSEEERQLRTPEKDLETVAFFQAVIDGDNARIREIEAKQARAEHVRADMSIGVGGVGMVPEGFYNLVQLLTKRVNKLRNLCTVVPMAGGAGSSMKVPVVTTNPAPAVYAEGADMTGGTEPVIGSATLTPVKIGQVIMLSRELMEDTPLPTVTLLANLVTEAIGSAEDYHIAHPTPTDFTGNLVDDSTASADTFDDDAETLATLASKLYELPLDAINNATWLINPAAAEALSALTATNSRQIFLPFNDAPSYIGSAEGGVGMLLGRPVRVLPITTVPADTAIVGDLSAYTLLDREFIHVELDRHAAFKTDQVGVHVSRRVDGTVAQATRIRNHPAS